MATHSSILARRTPWAEEPSGQHTVHGVAKSQTRLSEEACGSGAEALAGNDQAFEMYGRITNKTESGAYY